jgi:hypothetical protein
MPARHNNSAIPPPTMPPTTPALGETGEVRVGTCAIDSEIVVVDIDVRAFGASVVADTVGNVATIDVLVVLIVGVVNVVLNNDDDEFVLDIGGVGMRLETITGVALNVANVAKVAAGIISEIDKHAPVLSTQRHLTMQSADDVFCSQTKSKQLKRSQIRHIPNNCCRLPLATDYEQVPARGHIANICIRTYHLSIISGALISGMFPDK